MKRVLSVVVAGLAAAGMLQGAAGGVTAQGRLVGQTQISFGCPGPVAVDGPSCNPWHPFAHARIAVQSAAGARRVVVSDDQGRFGVELPAGRYDVIPLPQPSTHGGPALHVRIRPARSTALVVRFTGFPQMY
jgi:hypothetical protein